MKILILGAGRVGERCGALTLHHDKARLPRFWAAQRVKDSPAAALRSSSGDSVKPGPISAP